MGIEQAYIERVKAARARMGMAQKPPVVVIPIRSEEPASEPRVRVGVKKFGAQYHGSERKYAKLRTAMRELEKARKQHDTAFQLNQIELAVLATAAHFCMSKADILGDCRYAHIAYPRHMAMYVAWKFMRISQSRIGRYFKRDHTTARTSVLNIDAMRDDGSQLVERDIAGILSLLSEFEINVAGYWGA